jgi:serine protease Do
MKNIVSLVIAGLIGGLVVVGTTKLISNRTNVSPRNSNTRFVNDFNTPVGTVDLSAAAAAASPAVVFIEASESKESALKRQNSQDDPFSFFFGFQMPPKKGTGSGVIISQDGYIVTNNHVVDFADEVRVTLSDSRKFTAKVVGTDPQSDLAVLKIDKTGLPAVQKGSSENLKIGEWVLAIGFPYDIGTTVTAGIISATHKKIGVSETRNAFEDFLQTDAVVNPGNSGGALVDAYGKLIGINTAIQTRTGSYEGYSFAIPVDMMSKVVDDIIKNGRVTVPKNQAIAGAQKPRMGIEMVPDQYFAETAREKNIDIEEGVMVDNVLDGGAAQRAGLLPYDVIVKINGKNMNSTNDIRSFIANAKANDVLKVVVFRNGQTKEIAVSLRTNY